MQNTSLGEQAILASFRAKEYVQSASTVITKARSLILNDTLAFESAPRIDELRRGLNKSSVHDKREAMKRTVAQMSKGVDMHRLFPDVVKNIHVLCIETRKLIYLFVVHYAEQCPQAALLSIAAFQRDLADPSMHVRSLALRTLSAIPIATVHPVVMLAIRKAAADVAWLVRKTAAIALVQAHRVVVRQSSDLYDWHTAREVLRGLLADRSVEVLAAAVMAWDSVFAAEVELLHPVYRHLCRVMGECDEWGQVILLRVLLRYARMQFCDPNAPSTQTRASTSHALAEGGNLTATSKTQLDHAVILSDEDEKREQGDGAKVKQDADDSTSSTTPSDTESSDATSSAISEFHAVPGAHTRKQTAHGPSSSASSPNVPLTHKKSNHQSDKNVSHVKRRYNEDESSSSDIDMTQHSNGVTASLDPDHELLLNSVRPLLQSLSAAVVVGGCALYYHLAPPSLLVHCVHPLMRVLRSGCHGGSAAVLQIIDTIHSTHPRAFMHYYKDFYLHPLDHEDIRKYKLGLLTQLVTTSNFHNIYHEWEAYVRDYHTPTVIATIRAIGVVAATHPNFSARLLRLLTPLLAHTDQTVVTETVVVLRVLLVHGKQSHVRGAAQRIARLMQEAMQYRIRTSTALAVVLWLVGEHIPLHPVIATAAPDCFRVFAGCFTTALDSRVKMEVLTLGAKIWLHLNESGTGEVADRFRRMFAHTVEVASYDADYAVRDYARVMECMTLPDNRQDSTEKGMTAASDTLRATLLHRKPAPCICDAQRRRIEYELGTFSHLLQEAVLSYKPLPAWSTAPPDALCRNSRANAGRLSTTADTYGWAREMSSYSDGRNSGSSSASSDSSSSMSPSSENYDTDSSGSGSSVYDSSDGDMDEDDSSNNTYDSESESESESSSNGKQEIEKRASMSPPLCDCKYDATTGAEGRSASATQASGTDNSKVCNDGGDDTQGSPAPCAKLTVTASDSIGAALSMPSSGVVAANPDEATCTKDMMTQNCHTTSMDIRASSVGVYECGAIQENALHTTRQYSDPAS